MTRANSWLVTFYCIDTISRIHEQTKLQKGEGDFSLSYTFQTCRLSYNSLTLARGGTAAVAEGVVLTGTGLLFRGAFFQRRSRFM